MRKLNVLKEINIENTLQIKNNYVIISLRGEEFLIAKQLHYIFSKREGE